jgi:hypothetical protein
MTGGPKRPLKVQQERRSKLIGIHNGTFTTHEKVNNDTNGIISKSLGNLQNQGLNSPVHFK